MHKWTQYGNATLIFIMVLFVVAGVSCGGLPTGGGDQAAVETAVAQTVAAQVVSSTDTATPSPADTTAPQPTVPPSKTPPPPTETPIPTETPEPTDTPTPTNTPQPTDTPTPTLTATPLPRPEFFDSFDTGLRPEWERDEDEAWASVNGRLTSLLDRIPLRIGDDAWTNYVLSVDAVDDVYCNFFIGSDSDGDGEWDRQTQLLMHYGNYLQWYTPGTDDQMPGARFEDLELPYNLKLIVKEDGTFTTLVNDEQAIEIVLAGYGSGGIQLSCDRGTVLDNFSVTPLDVP